MTLLEHLKYWVCSKKNRCAKAAVSLRLCFLRLKLLKGQKRGVESGTIQTVMISHKIADVF
jgi:hypothetical protein